jgi:hypothetical protein
VPSPNVVFGPGTVVEVVVVLVATVVVDPSVTDVCVAPDALLAGVFFEPLFAAAITMTKSTTTPPTSHNRRFRR